MMRRRLLLALVGVAVARPAAAQTEESEETEEAEIEAPRPAGITKEWIGFELTPISMLLASSTGPPGGKPPSRLDAGPGGSIRIGRYRWEYGYVIPFQASLYVTSRPTILMYLQLEGGLIVPGTERRLELGMGAGVGVLSVAYATGCDGSCVIGGKGALLSFVARFLVHQTPRFSAGVNIRGFHTLGAPEGELFGYYTGERRHRRRRARDRVRPLTIRQRTSCGRRSPIARRGACRRARSRTRRER
jgi:hypothetical protein